MKFQLIRLYGADCRWIKCIWKKVSVIITGENRNILRNIFRCQFFSPQTTHGLLCVRTRGFMVNCQRLTGRAIAWSTDLKRIMDNMLVVVTPFNFSVFPLMYWRDVLFPRAGWRNYLHLDTEVTRENKNTRDQIPPHNNFFFDVIPSF